MAIDYLGFAYAAVVTAGGVAGYAKAGSVPSLAAGLVFGSILGLGSMQISNNPGNYHLLLTTSTVLGGLMGYRFYNSGKVMPAGLVCALSAAMVVRLVINNVMASGVKDYAKTLATPE